MPAQQEARWPVTAVGWIVLGSMVALVAVLAAFLRASGLGVISNKLTVRTYFANSAGLKVGAEVDLDGVTIGTVKSITVTTDPERRQTPVQVVMKLDDKYQSSMHTDSTASMASEGALGDASIDIDSQIATGPELQDGDELHTLETPNLADTMKAGEVAAENLNKLVDKLDTIVDGIQSGKGSVGKLMSDSSLQDRLNATTSGVQQITAKLNGKDSTAGKLLNDSSLMDKFASVSNDVQSVDALVVKRSGGELKANIGETGKQVNALAADVNAGQGSVGMLMKDPAMGRNIKDLTAKGSALMAGIKQGNGTLGKLATDDQLKANLTKLESDSSALVALVRANPKKYLTFQFRIF